MTPRISQENVEVLEERIEKIENDQVFNLPDADIQVNAPRALRQTSMKAKREILQLVLGMVEESALDDPERPKMDLPEGAYGELSRRLDDGRAKVLTPYAVMYVPLGDEPGETTIKDGYAYANESEK